MLKNFTLVLLLLVGTLSAVAQLPNGSIAPDFTVTDLNGDQHNLNTYLNEGKSVTIDLSAAWCAPCWVYHQTHILEDLWQAHGPNGTNTMVVFMIESEATNTVDQIYGVDDGSGTRAGTSLGDWTEGVTYPIADDATVADDYELTFYPTIYTIRPDGKTFMVYDVYYPNFELMEYYLLNDASNDVGIFDFISGEAFCGETNVIAAFDVMNFGSDNVTSFTAEAVVDGSVVSSREWTGEIGTYNTARVALPSFTVNEPSLVDYRVSMPNGVADESTDLLQSVDSVAYFNLPTRDELTIRIRTDFWPEEISWRLEDENGTTIVSSADLGPLSCDTEYQQTAPINGSGCYEFIIEDSFGDGMLNGPVNPQSHNCNTQNGQESVAMGLLEIVNNEGTVLYNNINYGDGTALPIEGEGTSAVNEVSSIASMKVFPNPASTIMNIDFSLTETTEMEVSVINMIGQQVYTFGNDSFQAGTNQLQIDASQLQEGIYFLSFRSKDGVSSQRFTVSR